MKWILTLIIAFGSVTLMAQAQHEAFKQDKELEAAFLQKNLSAFIDEPVTFIFDTLERQVNAVELQQLMKTYVPTVKNSVIRKASETNNGFVQSFGLYKGDDALYYVRFTLNPLTSKLEEVVVEKNN
jgi:hypothetical protein